ncbi:MAG: GspH/FimT family pseudopilin [Candidatus Sumerlaeia bacterium]
MTSTTGPRNRIRWGKGLRRGMTLIELILVMGLLAMIFAWSAPSLSRFMKGRKLDQEARRLLSMTREARSEAVTRGVPMEMWLIPEEDKGGIRPQDGFDPDGRLPRYEMRLEVEMELSFEPDALDLNGEANIRFLPDGTVDSESPDTFVLMDKMSRIEIRLSETGPNFEIGEKEARKQ